MTPLCAFQFAEKYKLIPKQLRSTFLTLLEDDNTDIIIEKTIDCYHDDEKLEDCFNLFYEDVLDDILDVLYTYEDYGHMYEDENWLYLIIELDNICDCHYAFNDVIIALLKYLQSLQKPITLSDVVKFRNKAVLKQIKQEVAYRPGNIGYEYVRDRFLLNCSYFQ